MKTEDSNTYQWQGENVSARFGYVIQNENVEKPMCWYNFECYTSEQLDGRFKDNHFVRANGLHFALIPAIEVEAKNGYRFLLSNHYGIGVSKLLKGGWPNHAHFSLSGEFHEDNAPYYAIKEFDLDGYEAHESARRNWQKKNYPVEFERVEMLRSMITRTPIINT